MAQTVKVRMRKPGRVFTFLVRNIPLNRNDHCVVRSDRGLEYGVVVMPPEDCSEDEENRFKMTVVRRSTHHDDTTHSQLKLDEERAVSLCREKIRDRKLPMKLVDCEYSFDRKKIIFYFTAEDRVDFRELVRDLAQELKARIELRHIQVRDEAKIVGGIGTCGRELCCTTWMREFVPISMKMAKKQNLSLNPSSISGQCGRLMCCLSYENDQYTRAKKTRRESAPPPEPAEIREKMEENAEAAVGVLKDTTLSDVIVEKKSETPRRERSRDDRPRRERPRRERPTRGPQPDSKSEPKPEGAQSSAPPAKEGEAKTEDSGDAPKRRRRRRRRGGRGRGKKPEGDA